MRGAEEMTLFPFRGTLAIHSFFGNLGHQFQHPDIAEDPGPAWRIISPPPLLSQPGERPELNCLVSKRPLPLAIATALGRRKCQKWLVIHEPFPARN